MASLSAAPAGASQPTCPAHERGRTIPQSRGECNRSDREKRPGKAPSVGVELVDVPDVTEGPPHLLDDLHVFECRLQRFGGGLHGIDRRVTGIVGRDPCFFAGGSRRSPASRRLSRSCRTVSSASRCRSRNSRASSASRRNCSASFLVGLAPTRERCSRHPAGPRLLGTSPPAGDPALAEGSFGM